MTDEEIPTIKNIDAWKSQGAVVNVPSSIPHPTPHLKKVEKQEPKTVDVIDAKTLYTVSEKAMKEFNVHEYEKIYGKLISHLLECAENSNTDSFTDMSDVDVRITNEIVKDLRKLGFVCEVSEDGSKLYISWDKKAKKTEFNFGILHIIFTIIATALLTFLILYSVGWKPTPTKVSNYVENPK